MIFSELVGDRTAKITASIAGHLQYTSGGVGEKNPPFLRRGA
jgi:hypothetical protein